MICFILIFLSIYIPEKLSFQIQTSKSFVVINTPEFNEVFSYGMGDGFLFWLPFFFIIGMIEVALKEFLVFFKILVNGEGIKEGDALE